MITGWGPPDSPSPWWLRNRPYPKQSIKLQPKGNQTTAAYCYAATYSIIIIIRIFIKIHIKKSN